jgi:hypothetical protein
MDYTKEVEKLNSNIKTADARLHQLWLRRDTNPNYDSDFKTAHAAYSEAHAAFDKFLLENQKDAWVAYQHITHTMLSFK